MRKPPLLVSVGEEGRVDKLRVRHVGKMDKLIATLRPMLARTENVAAGVSLVVAFMEAEDCAASVRIRAKDHAGETARETIF
jgi:hypothetical protein